MLVNSFQFQPPHPQQPGGMPFPQQAFYASPPLQQQPNLQQQQAPRGFSPNINNISRGQLSPPAPSGGRLDVSTSPVNGSSPSSSMDNR